MYFWLHRIQEIHGNYVCISTNSYRVLPEDVKPHFQMVADMWLTVFELTHEVRWEKRCATVESLYLHPLTLLGKTIAGPALLISKTSI